MSESGESQPQDDSDEDIYKDFADFNFGDELAKLEHSKETIKKEALDLSEQIKVLTKENEELRKSNEILKKNMSALLKTAQAEVQRKDSLIQELRNKIDSFAFRRKNKITKDMFTSTQDLEITVKMKNEPAENPNENDTKRSKSKECRSSSESERTTTYLPNQTYQKEQKKKETEDERENLNCDNNRKYGYYRDSTRRKSRHSDIHYKPNDKKENHFRENSKKYEPGYRGPISDNHKGHLKYHSLDRRKRSRSSDRRFTYRRRNSRTRRRERLEENSEKWRREIKDVSESIKRRRLSGKDKSRSRECSRGSKELSLDPPKSRSSTDKDSSSKNKEISNKSKETNSVKIDSDESKKGRGHSDKEKNEKNEVKPSVKAKRISKDESLGKNEKISEMDKFSTKSPLDALYNEMLTSRNASRFTKLGSGVTKVEPDLEEGKSAKVADQEGSHVEEEQEDWTLSFKNERRDKARPMTLYSKRMMQKLSESKETESLSKEEKTVAQDTTLKEMKKAETEKEPGELTDDESVIENSKEFQELTKVASIESLTIEKPNESEVFKEPITKEPLIVKKLPQIESKVKEPDSSNEVQREIQNVIEYSPFKNNYKLIEISPLKPPDKEQIADLHQKRTSTGQLQKEVESSIFNLLSSLSGVPFSSKMEAKETKLEESKKVEDDSEKKRENKMELRQNEKSNEKTESKSGIPKNSKSKKSDIKKPEKKVKSIGEEKSDDAPGDATQFLDFFLLTTSPSKPVVPQQPETPGKTEKATNLSDSKSDAINSSAENAEVKIPNKENTKTEEERKKPKKESEKTGPKKQDKSKDIKKAISKKERQNKPNSKIHKRKRNSEGERETKKPRLDESPRKRTRSQQNSGNKTDEPKPESETESEIKVNEDITTFEFFKPISKKNTLDTSTECKMAAMSVANIVCLESPNKGVANLKNLMINEQMILNYLDSKNPALCSPLMTPRRLLKNDLMLTDSEDDSGNKGNVEEEEVDGMSESENSECESDSGASDFVDLL